MAKPIQSLPNFLASAVFPVESALAEFCAGLKNSSASALDTGPALPHFSHLLTT